MKKLFSLALSLAMVFLLSAAAFAATPLSGYPSTQKIEINEYEALKKLAEETPAVLSASGYSSAEIAKIQNYQETYFSFGTTVAGSDSGAFRWDESQ